MKFSLQKIDYLSTLFLKRAAELEQVREGDIGSITPEDLSNMESIELEQFKKYDYPYSDSAEDIEDDLQQPGFSGIVLRDGKSVVGYLYGYYFIMDDNWDEVDLESSDNRWFVDNKEEEINNFKRAAYSNKVFYITNLAILPKYGSQFLSMVLSLKKALKEGGIEYVVMGALSDSYRLISQGGPNLLRRLGVKPILERAEDDQVICVMKVIQ